MSNASTTQGRFVKGVFASGFGQITTLIVQIFGVSLFLKMWGAELYGQWVILSTVPNYLQICDLSFGTAAANTMTFMVAAGDRESAKKVYQSAWLLVVYLSLAIGLVIVGLTWALPVEKILCIQNLGHLQVCEVVTLLIGQIVVSQQGGILNAAYRCDGQFALGTMVINYLRLAEFAVTVAVLLLHGSLVMLAGSVLVTRSLGYIITYWHVCIRVPWLRLGVSDIDWETLRPTVGPALAYNVFPLGQVMNVQGTVFVVQALFGPVAVTLFSTARTLSRVVLQISVALSNSMWVELSRAFGAQDVTLARHLHRRLCQLGVWLCLFGSLLLALIGPWIYSVWTHHQALDPKMFDILLVVVVVNSLWNCSYIVPMSINRHQTIAPEYVAVMVFGLAASYFFGKSFGLVGVASGLLCAEFVMNIAMLRKSLPMVSDTFGPFIRTVFSPPIAWVYSRARSLL